MIKSTVDQFKRDVLSGYCLEECTVHCCEFGAHSIFAGLTATKSQLEFLTEGADVDPYEHILELREGFYDLYDVRCPKYDKPSRKCTIHSEELRPAACASFPIETDGEIVMLDSQCPYVWYNWEQIAEHFTPMLKPESIGISIPLEVGFVPALIDSKYDIIKESLSNRYYLPHKVSFRV